MTQLVERHRRACAGFANVATQFDERQWGLPTPCTDWDARALVEHVIGFHEFLLLRPLGVRANRPKTGPAARWSATADALLTALDTPGTVDRETELPGRAKSSARAAGMGNATDMFRPEVAVNANADASIRLIALCGRDPEWEPSAS